MSSNYLKHIYDVRPGTNPRSSLERVRVGEGVKGWGPVNC